MGVCAGLMTSTTLGQSARVLCRLTPPQVEGPFYPVEHQLERDNDLTRVKGQRGRAKGQEVYLIGRVLDDECHPVKGAVVEIWQASANGRYNHPRDRGNPLPLDPSFQYHGTHMTDEKGQYLFKTIKPGQYQAEPGWIRPSHVHFKVRERRFGELTTQMYFAGDPYLEADYIFRDIPRSKRGPVVVSLEEPRADMEPDARVCRFDLTLGEG